MVLLGHRTGVYRAQLHHEGNRTIGHPRENETKLDTAFYCKFQSKKMYSTKELKVQTLNSQPAAFPCARSSLPPPAGPILLFSSHKAESKTWGCWGSEAAMGALDQALSKASSGVSPWQGEAASAGALLARKGFCSSIFMGRAGAVHTVVPVLAACPKSLHSVAN